MRGQPISGIVERKFRPDKHKDVTNFIGQCLKGGLFPTYEEFINDVLGLNFGNNIVNDCMLDFYGINEKYFESIRRLVCCNTIFTYENTAYELYKDRGVESFFEMFNHINKIINYVQNKLNYETDDGLYMVKVIIMTNIFRMAMNKASRSESLNHINSMISRSNSRNFLDEDITVMTCKCGCVIKRSQYRRHIHTKKHGELMKKIVEKELMIRKAIRLNEMD